MREPKKSFFGEGTKKVQQFLELLYFLQQLKKFNLQRTMMVHLYTVIIKSILICSIIVWYTAATNKNKGRLQCIIHSEEKVIGHNLPSLQNLRPSRTVRRAGKIMTNLSHPSHGLFKTHYTLQKQLQ